MHQSGGYHAAICSYHEEGDIMIKRLLRFLFAQERIEMPDGEIYVRHWPVSEKQPRPDGRWRRLRGRGK